MYLRIVAAMFAIAVMAGCNTMSGAGNDVKSVGPGLENSVEKDGLPCEPHRLRPALLVRRACV